MADDRPDHAVEQLTVSAVHGLPELRPGDDLVAAIADAAPDLRDGDVLVVTSKVVSKVEGRLIAGADADRDAARERAIADETVRVVAQRGPLSIVQTRQGLVLAAAGVDESNVPTDEIALLPVDPDASAAALRDGLRARLGIEVGVVVSDSMGRPWRTGIVDNAIGVAGLQAVFDARGRLDRFGAPLEVTQVAVADEVAAAADLVKGKLRGIPVAVVRGLAEDGKLPDDGLGTSPLLRPADEDLFRLGTAEAVAVGRADVAGAAAPAPPLHASAVATIEGFVAATPADASLREAFLAFLSARPDAMWRSCVPGHVTASTMVVDVERQAVLLTLHPRAGLWVQVGGHCEAGDASVLAAARREAAEESGLAGLQFETEPLSLAVHPITCALGVPTRHFDVQYVARASADRSPVRTAESLDLRWFPWDRLPDGAAPELPAQLERVRRRLTVR